MKPGIKTSEFWTHIGVVAGTVAGITDTLSHNDWVTAHPLVSAVIIGIGLLVIGISQAAYTIGRSIVKSNVTPSVG